MLPRFFTSYCGNQPRNEYLPKTTVGVLSPACFEERERFRKMKKGIQNRETLKIVPASKISKVWKILFPLGYIQRSCTILRFFLFTSQTLRVSRSRSSGPKIDYRLETNHIIHSFISVAARWESFPPHKNKQYQFCRIIPTWVPAGILTNWGSTHIDIVVVQLAANLHNARLRCETFASPLST